MNIRAAFVTDFQAAKAIEPTESALNHPAVLSKIRILTAAFFNFRFDLLISKLAAKKFRIVSLVASQSIGTLTRPAFGALNGGNGFNCCKSFFDIMSVCRTQANNNRDSFSICNKVAFSPCLSTVRRIAAGLKPPFGAAMFEESMRNLFQPICPSSPSSFKNALWIFSQTPSFCHFSSRRQAVIPQPQPISCGKSSQGIPVRKTKTIAMKAWRFPMGGRPLLPLAFSAGSNASILFHNSSLTISRAIENLRVLYGYRFKLGFC